MLCVPVTEEFYALSLAHIGQLDAGDRKAQAAAGLSLVEACAHVEVSSLSPEIPGPSSNTSIWMPLPAARAEVRMLYRALLAVHRPSGYPR